MRAPAGFETSTIHIGKNYGDGKEKTEVDLSFEGDGFLVLVEAKLYSPMNQRVMVSGTIRSPAS